jgi:hypothetical protein
MLEARAGSGVSLAAVASTGEKVTVVPVMEVKAMVVKVMLASMALPKENDTTMVITGGQSMPKKNMVEKAMECSSPRWCMCSLSLCTWRPNLRTLEWGYRTRDLLTELGTVVGMEEEEEDMVEEDMVVVTKTLRRNGSVKS